MTSCDDYTEMRFRERYSETIEEDYLTCEVCGDRRETLFEGDACEHCADECAGCGESFHPDLLEEDNDGDFLCEVCWDNAVKGKQWAEENL
jgi:hypothetical protein